MSISSRKLLPQETRGDRLAEIITVDQRVYVASQWQLMWWRFRKHRLAMISVVVVAFLCLIGVFCEFLAPQDPGKYDTMYQYAPPQLLRFRDESGWHLRPFVYGLSGTRNPETLELTYEEDKTKKYPVYFVAQGLPYKLWGVFPANLHLINIKDPQGTMFLLGTDRKGRDVLSRVLYGTRISMSIGLVGVVISLILGIFIGGISGYYGGGVDDLIQRVIEFLRSIPDIPLWMSLSAALPSSWPALRVYFGITIILSLIGWTGLARVVRGRFLALREEDFVMAARLVGASEMRIIWRHLVPSFLSHIIASITLSIPNMILSETALSFLGLGLRPPIVSWGVLLQEAQNVQAVVLAPWLFVPALFVIIAVLAYNFMGDGLRDAADPYAR